MPLPCFKCGKELEWVVDEREGNNASGQPWLGVMCSTAGNYGSRVFDSINRDRLYFNICDQCLVDNRNRLIWMRTVRQRDLYEYLLSDPFAGVELDPEDE